MTKAVSEAPANTQHVTTLLLAWSGGDRDALDQFVPLVHEELRRRARRAMFHGRANQRRRHSTVGQISPAACERRATAASR